MFDISPLIPAKAWIQKQRYKTDPRFLGMSGKKLSQSDTLIIGAGVAGHGKP